MMEYITSIKDELSREDFDAIPFINVDGYHSKTIAYSLWHVFRIEDIVAHSLILSDKQIVFQNDYINRMNSPIITTGNELVKNQISEFSKQLNLEELYNYIYEVKLSTDRILNDLSFEKTKRKITDKDKENLILLDTVSKDENAFWLIDYWCNKDVAGLIRMSFSRHWIMHIEACSRIIKKIQ